MVSFCCLRRCSLSEVPKGIASKRDISTQGVSDNSLKFVIASFNAKSPSPLRVLVRMTLVCNNCSNLERSIQMPLRCIWSAILITRIVGSWRSFTWVKSNKFCLRLLTSLTTTTTSGKYAPWRLMRVSTATCSSSELGLRL